MSDFKELGIADELLQRCGEASELDLLAKDLLINVTRFFRDAAVFKQLSKSIVPELVRNHPPDQPRRRQPVKAAPLAIALPGRKEQGQVAWHGLFGETLGRGPADAGRAAGTNASEKQDPSPRPCARKAGIAVSTMRTEPQA